MTWVSWRQQRLQMLIILGVVVVAAAALVGVGFDAASLHGHGGERAVSDRYGQFLSLLPMALLALPVLVGMFAGAPLFAREIEHRTHVFGLTQSISRTRWWATKLVMGGLPVTVAMLALGLVTTWTLDSVGRIAVSRMWTPMFEIQGLALGAYTLLAFTLGATAGLLVKNTLAAMVITITGYLGVLITVANGVRPHYAAPEYRTQDVPYDAWRVESGFLDQNGHEVAFSPFATCGTTDIKNCLRDNGVAAQFVRFHPVERFWSFQLIETGLFVLLAVALLGLGVWALHRRTT
jgi:hypothetical protein